MVLNEFKKSSLVGSYAVKDKLYLVTTSKLLLLINEANTVAGKAFISK